MLKKMKISTGITFIICMFALSLSVIAVFSLFNSIESKDNFNRTIVSTSNMEGMQSSIFNLYSGLAQVNGLLLQSSLNRTIDPQSIANAKDILANSKATMDSFMSTGFNSTEVEQAAIVLNKQFLRVLNTTLDKADYISNPAGMPDTLEKEMQERTILRENINAYQNIANHLNDNFIQGADSVYRQMVTMAIVVPIISIVLLVLVRIWLKRTLTTRMSQTSASIKKIASGDLSEEIQVGDENELGLMLVELEKMRVSLTGTVSNINDGVSRIYSNAQEIAQGNNDLSARTEEQASALQQTAASMEQLKTTVRQNADNAHTARQLAESASLNARNGGNVMTNLDDIMQQITQSSRQIADINGVIDSIANQTNILALNAAVEAARAGEQGRGFAVVAGEVRSLAKRSADAAKEISQLITTCVANMNTGSQQVDQAGTVMKDIVSSVTQVTDIMGEITSASDEQSAGINQIAQAVNEMDQVTQQNAAMVEEAALAANNLEMQSEELDSIISKFTINKNIGNRKTHRERDNGIERNRDKKTLRPGPVSAKQSEMNKSIAEEQWETF
ncbi:MULTISPECIES: methyl-accepting chemotaxis protein [Yersinia]|uniref:Methyl-accepting chemotaxis protein n=2 Tax=Yersinia bercovieri TaxID=634 RepID=A0A2G4U6N6_YERBE|nr:MULTISPECIES: methyl-accepting chemotaxis protein [Yersinia]PHZ28958.1 methyl-accepting chemotaxis protein [Yersinia bercovieri]QDW32088.1 HAMP domain-containing protein [Yersinia sp. KBS0713]QKJ06075.1 Tar ligand binding domain-containing protein [Yersinia bercovieri ATCC 43970]